MKPSTLKVQGTDLKPSTMGENVAYNKDIFDDKKSTNINPYTKNSNMSYWADSNPITDIRKGGQWGLLPQLGLHSTDGKMEDLWLNEQGYQKSNIIPVVLTTPRFLDLLPATLGTKLKMAIKAMFETQAKSITGLDSSLTVATNDHALGLSGANYKEPSDVTRAESNISLNLIEKVGNPFEILLDIWIRYGIMDPDLKVPLITRLMHKKTLRPKLWTSEWYTMSVLFIEPDTLLRRPVHAWLVNNLFPTSNPDITGGKDKSAAKTLKEMSVEFGGFAIPSTNVNVMSLAKNVLKTLKPREYNPEDIQINVKQRDVGLDNPGYEDVAKNDT